MGAQRWPPGHVPSLQQTSAHRPDTQNASRQLVLPVHGVPVVPAPMVEGGTHAVTNEPELIR